MQRSTNCFVTLVTDLNQTYFGEHFAIYTNIESLCSTPETNIKLDTNYTPV